VLKFFSLKPQAGKSVLDHGPVSAIKSPAPSCESEGALPTAPGPGLFRRFLPPDTHQGCSDEKKVGNAANQAGVSFYASPVKAKVFNLLPQRLPVDLVLRNQGLLAGLKISYFKDSNHTRYFGTWPIVSANG